MRKVLGVVLMSAGLVAGGCDPGVPMDVSPPAPLQVSELLAAPQVDETPEVAAELEVELVPEARELRDPVPKHLTGWIKFEHVWTNCPVAYSAAGWSFSWFYGDVWIHDGQIDIGLPMFPVLTGKLDGGSAEVSGFTTWMSDGYSVACDVDGEAHVGPEVVEGEVTETLSSGGSLNCATTAGFVFEPDE